ncbi:Highly reducing polyketide synthase gloL [Colletotrichum fructicola Nara gc5]|uniref:Highly reducing polyketide synthase gloL n=1 Tax=Colletotrichum fructicola (strain Nara gc5) TaxID=1213859 RepID=A0A7J6J6T7_COLFN|nr:Highly reducing polyketide synthase gloL [Colletotrichum fructicola Nara gc5]
MGEHVNVSRGPGDDPVVVCGMAMRLPGGVSNADDFWDMLMQKRCASVPVPKDRFDIGGYYSEKPRPGTMQTKKAYFLDHVQLDRFDASHFSYGRSELEQMDPLHRLLLEVSWECLENAGETDWQGETIGCYVGSFFEDWSVEMQRDPQYYSNYPTGKWDIMLSNRISHAFDFRGPSMTVKTGCSSSLVSLNLAVQSLELGECTSALVAGCSLFLSAPLSAAGASGALGNIASPDGVCKTFDADSDGIGRGEAINAVYIKRLSQALRDGNPVRAVIRSIATQHDGREPGLIIPNGYAQEALIRHTYDKAGITKYSETSFFECHGTGTRIGDLTEVGAIERIFREEGVIIGAVKPNVGHSEGAAALTSVIKVILMLEKGVIAPNTNFNTPNPNLGQRTTTQPELRLSVASSDEPKTLVFVFNGQGAQWPTMGKNLILKNIVFRQCIRDLDGALRKLKSGWTIEGELLKSETDSRIMKSEYALPCSTAIQIGLLAVLRSWGVIPNVVTGHSSGEIAAAFAAGAITADEAIIVAYFRGYVLNRTGTQHSGAMAVIGAGSKDISERLLPGVVIACENSHVNTTISGDACAVEAMVTKFKAGGIFAKLLDVDLAFHSAHMKDFGLAYEEAIRPFLSAATPRIPMFSSVTGDLIRTVNSLGATHWQQSLVQPVLFNKALTNLLEQIETPNLVIVEVGARPSLKSPIRQVMESMSTDKASYLPTLEENKDCYESLLRLAGRLFCEGVKLKYQAITPPGKTLFDVPAYTWVHEQSFQGQHRLYRAYRDCKYPMHELLGSQVFETSALEPRWRKVLLLEDIPWLGDHVVNDQVIIPFAAYISIAEQALRQVNGGLLESFSAQDFSVSAALHLEPGRPVEIHTRLRRLVSDENAPVSYDVQITSWKDNIWTEHCHTVVTAEPHRAHRGFAKREFPRQLSRATWYKITQDLGFTYGPSFRRLEHITVSPSAQQATARVNPPENTSKDSTCSYLVHPTALDQCLQTTGISLCHGLQRKAKYMATPTYIQRIFVRQYAGPFWATGMMNQVAQDHTSGTVHAYADDGEEIAIMEGIEAHQIRSSLQGETEAPPIVSAPHWRPHASFFPFQTLNEAPFFDADDIKRILHLLFLLLLEMQSSYAQVDNDIGNIPDQGATKAWVDQQIQRAQEAGYGVLSATTCQNIVQDNIENRQAAQQKIRIELQSSRLHDMDLTMEKLFKNPLQHTKDTLRDSIVSQGLWSLRAKRLLEVAMPILTHTNPQPKILQIGSADGANSTTLALLQLLQPKRGTQLFSTYTYASISPNSLENAEGDFSDVQGFEVRSWDAMGGDKNLAQSFDIIVCADILSTERDTSQDLLHIKQLLRPSGVLILPEALFADSFLTSFDVLLQNQTPHISKDVLFPIIHDLGFDLPKGDQHKNQVNPILRLRHLNQLESSSTPVSIVTNKEDSTLIESFKSVLHSYSIPVRAYNADTCISESGSLLTDGTLVFFLDLDRPWIYHLKESEFPAFIQLLSTGTSKRPIVWVTPFSQIDCNDPRSAMIYGLARTLRSELKADITIVEVDLADVSNSDKCATFLMRIVQHLPHRCFDGALDPDFEFAITREHGIVVPRHQWTTVQQELCRCSEQQQTSGVSTFAKLAPRITGNLSSLRWVRCPLPVLHARQLRVEVKAAAVNKEDVIIAQEASNPNQVLFGQEAAGIVTVVGDDATSFQVGDRVVILSTGKGAVASHLDVLPSSCLRLGEDFAFEAAAAMPLACVAAEFTVGGFGRIASGEVSIAVQIRFIITSESDRLLLENAFGIAVDFIVSTPEDALSWPKATCMIGFGGLFPDWALQYLSPTGIFLDVLDHPVKAKDFQTVKISASQAYRIVDMQALSHHSPESVQRVWKLCEKYFLGDAQPADWARLAKIFKPSQVHEAFRAAAGQKNQPTTKVVLQTPTTDPQSDSPLSSVEVMPASPQFRSDAAYLLVGGLGGIGRAVATWMAEHGAGELIFLSRSAGTEPQVEYFLGELRSQGCVIKAVTGSVAILEDVSRAVNAADRPIAGVFQMSMVLRDNAILRMTYDEWRACIEPKTQGTENLHKALAQSSLDFFVLFSSIGGLVGNIGQANYNAANTYLDAFVRYRHNLGLPASVIDIGIMGGIGVIASTGNMQDRAQAAGYHVLCEEELLEAITISIHHSRAGSSSNRDDAYSHLSQMALGLWSEQHLADPSTHVLWKKNAHMGAAHSIHPENLTSGTTELSSTKSELATIMKIAKSTPDRLLHEETIGLIVELLGTAIAQLLALSSAEIGPEAALDDLGLDSLNANELTSWISQHLLVDLPLPDLIQSTTIHDLADKIARLLEDKFGEAQI